MNGMYICSSGNARPIPSASRTGKPEIANYPYIKLYILIFNANVYLVCSVCMCICLHVYGTMQKTVNKAFVIGSQRFARGASL